MIDKTTGMAHLHIPFLTNATKKFYEDEACIYYGYRVPDFNLVPFENLNLNSFVKNMTKVTSILDTKTYYNLDSVLKSEGGKVVSEIYKDESKYQKGYDIKDSQRKSFIKNIKTIFEKATLNNPLHYDEDIISQSNIKKDELDNQFRNICNNRNYNHELISYFYNDYLDICPSHITLYTCAFPITALRATIAKISENIPWCVIEVVPTEELSEADKKEVESYGDFVYVLPPVPIKDYNPEIFERYYKDYVRFLKSMTAEQEEEYLKLVKEDCCPECGKPIGAKDKVCSNCGCPIN